MKINNELSKSILVGNYDVRTWIMCFVAVGDQKTPSKSKVNNIVAPVEHSFWQLPFQLQHLSLHIWALPLILDSLCKLMYHFAENTTLSGKIDAPHFMGSS